MFDFLSDGSVRGLLVVMGIVLLLFAAYFGMVYLSNQSLRKLGERKLALRRSEDPPPASRLYTQARWVVLILLGVMGGLCGLLVLIVHLSR